MSTGADAEREPIAIAVHYDLASTLCYVAHRCLERIAPRLAEADLDFVWTPLDLAVLLGWRRGGTVEPLRLANVQRVAEELGVPVRTPGVWLDSRRAHGIGLALLARGEPEREAAWRERVLTGVFEQGQACDEPEVLAGWCRDLAIELPEAEVAEGVEALARNTHDAAEAMVTGVPTFMLTTWPMGGIQDDDTMVRLLTRFAARQRGER